MQETPPSASDKLVKVIVALAPLVNTIYTWWKNRRRKPL